MKLRKRKGSAYLLVVVVFLFVSLFSALIFSNVSQSIFQLNTYGLQMQCYYLTQQASEAAVAVLLSDNNALLQSETAYPQEDTMIHYGIDGTTYLGKSKITLTKESHDYYGESKRWAVARIVMEPPSSSFLAAPKNFFGLWKAPGSKPPESVLPDAGTTML